MNTLIKVVSAISKIAGILVGIDCTSLNPKYGLIIFAIASCLKDICNVILQTVQKIDNTAPIKSGDAIKLTSIIALLFILPGCANFNVVMTTVKPNGDKVTTTAHGYTLFNSKSDLSKLAIQNGPRTNDQYIGIGALTQSAENPITPQMLQTLGQLFLQSQMPIPMGAK